MSTSRKRVSAEALIWEKHTKSFQYYKQFITLRDKSVIYFDGFIFLVLANHDSFSETGLLLKNGICNSKHFYTLFSIQLFPYKVHSMVAGHTDAIRKKVSKHHDKLINYRKMLIISFNGTFTNIWTLTLTNSTWKSQDNIFISLRLFIDKLRYLDNNKFGEGGHALIWEKKMRKIRIWSCFKKGV